MILLLLKSFQEQYYFVFKMGLTLFSLRLCNRQLLDQLPNLPFFPVFWELVLFSPFQAAIQLECLGPAVLVLYGWCPFS